jgi:hypothetical protein
MALCRVAIASAFSQEALEAEHVMLRVLLLNRAAVMVEDTIMSTCSIIWGYFHIY